MNWLQTIHSLSVVATAVGFPRRLIDAHSNPTIAACRKRHEIRGAGFWHETHHERDMEAVYDDIPVRLGFGQFAPLQPARGPMFCARTRAKVSGTPPPHSR